jgi:prohibitin 1
MGFIFVLLMIIACLIVSYKINFQLVSNILKGSAAFFGFIAITCFFSQVPAGHVGVIDVFGNVSDRTLKPGISFINPIASIKKFSIKTQEVKEAAKTPSSEGLNVDLEASVLFHLNSDKANEVYKSIGTEYIEIVLVPQFRSAIRSVTARYKAEALYSSKRDQLEIEIKQELEKMVGPRGVTIESVPLRSLQLPAKLTEAIEEKQQADQASQKMQFVLLKEKQEADRKKIEAEGIKNFQQIVVQGVNEQLLKWEGIKATTELAKSSNTKIVIIGAGNSGLPIILGNDK